MVFNPENYCIPHRQRLLGETTKQPLSNFEPQEPWKYKQLWGLRTDPSCLLKKCILVIDLGQIVSLESFQPLSIMLFPIKGKIQLFLKTPIVG